MIGESSTAQTGWLLNENSLDAVEDIMGSATFQDIWDKESRTLPDLERLLSRIHAGQCRVKDL